MQRTTLQLKTGMSSVVSWAMYTDIIYLPLAATKTFLRTLPCHKAQQCTPLSPNYSPAIQNALSTRRRQGTLVSSTGDRLFLHYCNTPTTGVSMTLPSQRLPTIVSFMHIYLGYQARAKSYLSAKAISQTPGFPSKRCVSEVTKSGLLRCSSPTGLDWTPPSGICSTAPSTLHQSCPTSLRMLANV